MIKQLRVGDATQSHMADAQYLADMMKRRGHTPDALHGIETEVKRTATEIAKMTASGANILSTGARLLYAQGLVPLAEMSVMNNVGDYAKELQMDHEDDILVAPEDIVGMFDYPINDGRLPITPDKDAEVWLQMFQTIAQVPPLAQVFDLFEIFSRFARALGVKNVDDFRIKANVTPDQNIQRMVEAGDVIPVEQFGREGMAA
ncbi:MAG: hypothetical protein JRJ78_13895 [Deltaproteobacteria bacterium]|nr:hypothetical protein [Deltaproteobacteria bacterium]